MTQELREPKTYVDEVVFDKDKQFGDFVEIVPIGRFSMHRQRSFAGEWNMCNVSKVKETLFAEAEAFLPRALWLYIKAIVKPPTFEPDPYTHTGTVGWKYTPLQKGSE